MPRQDLTAFYMLQGRYCTSLDPLGFASGEGLQQTVSIIRTVIS
jgi:hypothetical protein